MHRQNFATKEKWSFIEILSIVVIQCRQIFGHFDWKVFRSPRHFCGLMITSHHILKMSLPPAHALAKGGLLFINPLRAESVDIYPRTGEASERLAEMKFRMGFLPDFIQMPAIFSKLFCRLCAFGYCPHCGWCWIYLLALYVRLPPGPLVPMLKTSWTRDSEAAAVRSTNEDSFFDVHQIRSFGATAKC